MMWGGHKYRPYVFLMCAQRKWKLWKRQMEKLFLFCVVNPDAMNRMINSNPVVTHGGCVKHEHTDTSLKHPHTRMLAFTVNPHIPVCIASLNYKAG